MTLRSGGKMAAARLGHHSVVLPENRVLLVGGLKQGQAGELASRRLVSLKRGRRLPVRTAARPSAIIETRSSHPLQENRARQVTVRPG